MNRLFTGRALMIVLPAWYVVSIARAQTDSCEPRLLELARGPDGYRLRGDRCEGVYDRDVAGSSISLVGLTRVFEDYNLASGRDLMVTWASPPSAPAVHLRAIALRRRLYYRMDAIRPASSSSYSWNTGLLANLNLGRKELGVLAWAPLAVGGSRRDVYLPLEIRQGGSGPAPGGYRLVLVPGADLTQIFLTVAPLGPDGRPGRALLENQSPGVSYYPAERAFEVPIGNLKTPGIYRVEIAATLRSGSPTSVNLWVYHSVK